jgi:O-antigen ligase
MTTKISEIVVEHARPTNTALLRLVLFVGLLVLAPVAAFVGGMSFLVMALAAGLAIYVWSHPEEAPASSLLFLLAAQILLPSTARIYNESLDISQMYIWAFGLLLITISAVIRVGLRRVFAVPLSALAFLGVALASATYAELHGAATSYVLRQLYGILLLITYLGIALHAGSEESLLKRVRVFGVLCALCFIVYYLAIFGVYGFHKEMSTSGAQASLLAILLVIAGLNARKFFWVLSALLLLSIPALLFQRRDLGAFLVALPIAFAAQSETRKRRLAYICLAALLALPGVFPQIAQSVGDQIKGVPMIGEMIPSSAQDSSSLYERAIQAQFALDAVRKHPWLGEGLGSTFEWVSPFQGTLGAGYVDSGWAYLFQKMGFLGAGAFIWFLVTIFKAVSRESVGLTACFLSAALVTMVSEPIFFQFTTAPFMATFAGLLLAKKNRNCKLAAPARQQLARGFRYAGGRGLIHG